MKCRLCRFETESLSRDDAMVEMDKHYDLAHTEETFPQQMLVELAEMAFSHGKTAQEVVDMYFAVRSAMGVRYFKEIT